MERSMSDVVEVSIAERIARITLNRPAALNAFDESLLEGLARALDHVEADSSLRAAVITGAGDAFCVGLDIGLLGRAFADHAYFEDVLHRFMALLLRVEALPIPVIAAVNGLARAGGFELLLACDLVVAATEARIGDTHLAFGLLPGGGASQRLPRRVGHQAARDLLYTGRWIDGAHAEQIGLALRAVPRADLDDAVEQICARLRPLSRVALATTKIAIERGAELPLREALAVELELFATNLANDPAVDEGYRAFVEERAPRWD